MACMGEKYIQDFGRETGRKAHLEDLAVYGRIILNIF